MFRTQKLSSLADFQKTCMRWSPTKKQNVSRPGPQNASKIELKIIRKAVPGGFESNSGSCENISFYCLKHTSDASWTQQFHLKIRSGTLQETLSKKGWQRRATKRLSARFWEAADSKGVPKGSQLSSQVVSFFVFFLTFSYFFYFFKRFLTF